VKPTPALRLGQVLRRALRRGKLKLPRAHWKILNLLAACGTPALGGHRYVCAQCGQEHFVPHACGNRHCPSCQGAQAVEWLQRQERALLPVPYFHLVFPLPHRLNGLIRQNRRVMFNLLFRSASQTLLTFGRHELGAQLGISAVLHTWGQTLVEHYHLHCIVTGGGLALSGEGWVGTPKHWLFAVRALSRVFGGKFRAGLERLRAEGQLEFHGQIKALGQPAVWGRLMAKLKAQQWVVYAKRPFAGPEQVLAYLSRYTHRVAIGNRRLLGLEPGHVTFSYKDYAQAGRRKTMRLEVEEFVRRFCLHLLPKRFVKIRHYGLLGNRDRQQRLERARQSLGVVKAQSQPEPGGQAPEAPGQAATPAQGRRRCPHCGAAALVWVGEVPRAVRWIRPVWICDSS
jgi:hypothetical protein